MSRPKGPQLREAFRFAHWAKAQPKPPSWQQIQGFLECSSTKARKWRRLWLASINTPLQHTPAANGSTQQQGN